MYYINNYSYAACPICVQKGPSNECPLIKTRNYIGIERNAVCCNTQLPWCSAVRSDTNKHSISNGNKDKH